MLILKSVGLRAILKGLVLLENVPITQLLLKTQIVPPFLMVVLLKVLVVSVLLNHVPLMLELLTNVNNLKEKMGQKNVIKKILINNVEILNAPTIPLHHLILNVKIIYLVV